MSDQKTKTTANTFVAIASHSAGDTIPAGTVNISGFSDYQNTYTSQAGIGCTMKPVPMSPATWGQNGVWSVEVSHAKSSGCRIEARVGVANDLVPDITISEGADLAIGGANISSGKEYVSVFYNADIGDEVTFVVHQEEHSYDAMQQKYIWKVISGTEVTEIISPNSHAPSNNNLAAHVVEIALGQQHQWNQKVRINYVSGSKSANFTVT